MGQGALGRDLFLINGQVTTFDRPLYAAERILDRTLLRPLFSQAQNEHALVRATLGRLGRFDPAAAARRTKASLGVDAFRTAGGPRGSGSNAVAACGKLKGAGDGDQARFAVAAYAIDDGRVLWQEPLEAMPAIWGMALDSQGRVVIARREGESCVLRGGRREGSGVQFLLRTRS